MKPLSQTVVLVGLMGSGKTRIGIELARLLSLPFVDSDKEIERAAGLTVTEIFTKFGEAEFRKGEHKIIQRLLTGEPKILASGGGAFIQEPVRALIKKQAISVWLKTELETLLDRTNRSTHRPLLQVNDRRATMEKLMAARYPIYAEADITVTTDGMTPLAVAKQIRSALSEKGS